MSQQPPYDERTLLERIAGGDEQAFNTLYELYWQQVYSYFEQIVKSPEAAEELLTDLFVKLWNGRQWLHKVENAGGFLRTVARNKALDYLKTTAREKKRISAYRADMIMQIAANPADHLLNTEVQQIWREAMAQLSEQRRTIFLLHREEGLSYQEIADKLGISPATVKKTMFQALQSIRNFLLTYYKESLGALLLFTRI